MAAMHEYARNLLAHVEFVAAVVAEVKAARLVIGLDHVLHGSFTLDLLRVLTFGTLLGSLFKQSLSLQL